MFNAILEGTYFQDKGSYLKLLQRDILLGVTRIQDRDTLCLVGRTVTFRDLLPHGETEERILFLPQRSSLSFGSGIILPPYRDDIELINLDIARLLCMRDGRIFITENTRHNQAYMDSFQELLGSMHFLFYSRETQAYFERHVSLFK